MIIPATSEFLIVGNGLKCLRVFGEVDDLLTGDEVDVRKPQNFVDEGQESIHPGLAVREPSGMGGNGKRSLGLLSEVRKRQFRQYTQKKRRGHVLPVCPLMRFKKKLVK